MSSNNCTSAMAADNAMCIWPSIADTGLSEDAIRLRRSYIGGSDANVILAGETSRLFDLWQEKTGAVAAADLTGVLPVMMGSWTEAFNRQWYEKQTGLAVTEVGSAIVSASHPWRRATLDGMVPAKASVWEAKHVNAFAKPEEVLARYMPQLQHNMAVLGVENSILSVIYGNHKWEVYEVAADWMYMDDLLFAEETFWLSVLNRVPPAGAVSIASPKIIPSREVSFEGNNSWAVAAADWLENSEGARLFAEATRSLKDLLEGDVTRAWGHGIEARRSKSGAVTIKGSMA